MKHPQYSCVAIVALTFLYAGIAEAGLARTSGRASVSRDDGQLIYFVGQDNLNAAGLSDDAYDALLAGAFRSRVPSDENRGVSAMPGSSAVAGGNGSCIKALQEVEIFDIQDEIDRLEGDKSQFLPGDPAIAALDAEIDRLTLSISNDPCEWVFEEGEALELFGDFSMFYDIPEIEYAVNWNITGNGLNLNLAGEINADGLRISPDGDQFLKGGGVFLNSAAPAGLSAGLYNVSVAVTLTGPGGGDPAGEFFLASPDLDIDWERACIDDPAATAPGDIVCGWNTYETSTFVAFDPQPFIAPRTYFSANEILRITSVNNPPNPVSAPSTLMCSLLGLWLLRRKQIGAGRRAASTS